MNLPVMVHDSCIGFFSEICTAGLPKYHLGIQKMVVFDGHEAMLCTVFTQRIFGSMHTSVE